MKPKPGDYIDRVIREYINTNTIDMNQEPTRSVVQVTFDIETTTVQRG
jgi:hypothetical protein